MKITSKLKFVAMIAVANMLAGCSSSGKKSMDIVDTAVSAGQFKTLVAAVEAADLVETLKSPGPFTVFAPTDDAFAKLPPGTVENLLKPENKDQLVAILTYHVLSGKVMSADLVGQKLMAKTIQGSELNVDSTSSVMVNDAEVTKADILASNGVIHVIDTVLLPPQQVLPARNETEVRQQSAPPIPDMSFPGSINRYQTLLLRRILMSRFRHLTLRNVRLNGQSGHLG